MALTARFRSVLPYPRIVPLWLRQLLSPSRLPILLCAQASLLQPFITRPAGLTKAKSCIGLGAQKILNGPVKD